MASNVSQLIKQMAVEAVAASKPCDIIPGTVTGVSPLKIKTAQNITITQVFLQLTQNVTDHTVKADVSWSTASGDSISGEKELLIKNGLKVGDTVLMLRCAGGQKYIIFDKVV